MDMQKLIIKNLQKYTKGKENAKITLQYLSLKEYLLAINMNPEGKFKEKRNLSFWNSPSFE